MTQAEQIRREERIQECRRIVGGTPGYNSVERAVAQRMLETIYKDELFGFKMEAKHASVR